jgi:hypothetical protein
MMLTGAAGPDACRRRKQRRRPIGPYNVAAVSDALIDRCKARHPILYRLFLHLVVAAGMHTEAPRRAVDHAKVGLVAEGLLARDAPLHYTNDSDQFEMLHALGTQGRYERSQLVRGARYFALSADLSTPKHQTRPMLSVVLYLFNDDFKRVPLFVDVGYMVGRATGDALATKIVDLLGSGLDISPGELGGKLIAFSSDGGANFVGQFAGAGQAIKARHAGAMVLIRCAPHLVDSILKKMYKPIETDKSHVLHGMQNLIDSITNRHTTSPFDAELVRMRKAEYDRRIEERRQAKAAGLPYDENIHLGHTKPIKESETRWVAKHDSVDSILDLYRFVPALLTANEATLERQMLRCDAILALALIFPLLRELRAFTNATQHPHYELISLVPRFRSMITRLSAQYGGPNKFSGAAFSIYLAMRDAGSGRSSNGGGWFKRGRGTLVPKATATNQNPVPRQITALYLRCHGPGGGGVCKPVWSRNPHQRAGTTGLPTHMLASWFAHVAKKAEEDVGAFALGVLDALKEEFAAHMFGFSGREEDLVAGLDFMTHRQGFMTHKPGQPVDLDTVAAAAAGDFFSGVVSARALRAQSGAFAAEAAAAARALPARHAFAASVPVRPARRGAGDEESSNTSFWKTLATKSGISEWIKLGQVVAAIPVSSAENERHFSIVKQVMSAKRSKLHELGVRDALSVRFAPERNAARAMHRWLSWGRRLHADKM